MNDKLDNIDFEKLLDERIASLKDVPSADKANAYGEFLDYVKVSHAQLTKDAYQTFTTPMTFEVFQRLMKKMTNVTIEARRQGYDKGYEDRKKESPVSLAYTLGIITGVILSSVAYVFIP